jgi:hypothetical protein
VPQCPSHLLLKEKELTVEVVSVKTQQPKAKRPTTNPQHTSSASVSFQFILRKKIELSVELVSVNNQQPKAKRPNNQ